MADEVWSLDSGTLVSLAFWVKKVNQFGAKTTFGFTFCDLVSS